MRALSSRWTATSCGRLSKDAVATEPAPEPILGDDADVSMAHGELSAAALVGIAHELRAVTRTHDLSVVFCVSYTEPHGRLAECSKKRAESRGCRGEPECLI